MVEGVSEDCWTRRLVRMLPVVTDIRGRLGPVRRGRPYKHYYCLPRSLSAFRARTAVSKAAGRKKAPTWRPSYHPSLAGLTQSLPPSPANATDLSKLGNKMGLRVSNTDHRALRDRCNVSSFSVPGFIEGKSKGKRRKSTEQQRLDSQFSAACDNLSM